MNYILTPKVTPELSELMKALRLTRIKKFDGLRFYGAAPKAGDTVLCWGSYIPKLEGIKVINSSDDIPTLADLITLVTRCARTATYYNRCKGDYNLQSPDIPGSWVDPRPFSREFAVHIVNGETIALGEKVVMPGFILADSVDQWEQDPRSLAHPYIRAKRFGWHVAYKAKVPASSNVRKYAETAISVCKLDFGVVKILVADKTSSDYYVRIVDPAPILDLETLPVYVRALSILINEGTNDTGRVRETGESEQVDYRIEALLRRERERARRHRDDDPRWEDPF